MSVESHKLVAFDYLAVVARALTKVLSQDSTLMQKNHIDLKVHILNAWYGMVKVVCRFSDFGGGFCLEFFACDCQASDYYTPLASTTTSPLLVVCVLIAGNNVVTLRSCIVLHTRTCTSTSLFCPTFGIWHCTVQYNPGNAISFRYDTQSFRCLTMPDKLSAVVPACGTSAVFLCCNHEQSNIM